jgi:hypothetical protein
LRVQKGGYLPLEFPFLALVEETELPVAVLPHGTPLEARTVGGDGRPLAGIEAEFTLSQPWRSQEESPAEWKPARQRGVSDKDGRLAFLGDYQHTAELTATSPTFRGQSAAQRNPTAPLILRLSPRQAGTGVAVRPGSLRRIAGKVVDLASGRPVPGALVWSGWPLLAPVSRTDAEGAFQIEIAAGGEPWVEAAAAGFLPGDRQVLRSGVSAPVVLKLAPAATLSGVVVDAADRPVAGVRIVASPPVSRQGDLRWATARSRTDGGFRLTGLRPAGAYELTVTRQGFARTKATARTAPAGQPSKLIRIVLSDGKTAFGRVVDEGGRPIAGAELALVLPSGDTDATSTSGEDGRFEFRHLDPGTRDLFARARGYSYVHRPGVEIPAAAPTVALGTVKLQDGAFIEGRVTDTRGTPIEGAQVWISSSQPVPKLWHLEDAPQARTGPDGSFRSEGLRRGDLYYLGVEHPGHVLTTIPGIAAPTQEPIRIEMKTAHSLAGRVVGPEGEPVAGASLMRVEEIRIDGGISSRGSPLGETDPDGRFQVTGIAAGRLNIEVRAVGYAPRRIEGLQIPEGGDVEGLEIALERGILLAVRVRDAGGEPVRDAMVSASLEMPPSPRRFSGFSDSGFGQTDAQGQCWLSVPEPGTYQVTASQGARSATASATAGPGSAPVELRLPSGFEVSGWVRGKDGGGVSGLWVQLEGADQRGSSTQTGADGSFILSGVPDGEYRLRARNGSGRASPPLAIRVAGQPVRDLELRLDQEDGRATLSGHLLGLTPEALPRVAVTALPADPLRSMDQRLGRVGLEGEYRIEGLEPGDWKVQATLSTPGSRDVEGTVRIEPGATRATLDLEFPPGGLTLSGRVLVDGSPLVGAEIEVSIRRGMSASTSRGGLRTAWDGSFALLDLEPGLVTLTFVTPEGIGASRTVQLKESQEIAVDLATGRLRGTVVSTSGDLVEDASVTVEALLQGGKIISTPSLRSGPDGGFEAPRLASGPYRITVRKDGFAPAQAMVEVPAGDEKVVEIRLQ